MKPRVIALYLPQFHPTANNNKWWGKGFTEWTNVGKAKKLFPGHYQPRVPADLGYYDLRLPEVRKAQADMAKEYGIEGFCYYHYWFDVNRQELEMPFEQVLKSGEPNFPFMLCWANESWHAKFWNIDGTRSKQCLVEQQYGSTQQHTDHFLYLLKAFQDPRYLRYKGKPMFMIYKALEFDGMKEFIDLWQKLALDNGLDGIHFIAQTTDIDTKLEQLLSLGFDAVNSVRLYDPVTNRSFPRKVRDKLCRKIFPRPLIFDYKQVYKQFITQKENSNNIYPTLIPNWDHTPRSGNGGYLISNSTPSLFGMHVNNVLEHIKNKPQEDQIVFLKSWNEWGEGNYMEPDLKYGLGYLEEFKKAIKR